MSERPKRDLEATREALAAAAEELLTACTDSDEVTSRAVAGLAGVNPAMINYCYGSREELLYEVYRRLLARAQQSDPELSALMSADIPPKERVCLIHYTMMRLMIANFGISRAVTKFILLSRSEDAGLESLPYIMEHFAGRKSEQECRLIAFELSSLHETAVLQHQMLRDRLGTDLTDSDTLMKYVRKSVDRFLTDKED